MSGTRAWRQKKASFKRAGVEYVDVKRVAVDAFAQSTPEKTTNASSGSSPSGPDTIGLLEVLRSEVAECRRCCELGATRTQTVFADGDPQADLCFVGEAPGGDEDIQGVPFVGKAGQLLTKIIEACKLKRSEVYICNVLKCRPPGNRNPEPEEIENCTPFFDRQLELVRPKMIVALGKFAAARLLGQPPEKLAITKLRGSIMEYRGIPVMITLHPAYLLRNPAAKKDVWDDMKKVMREIGKPID